MSYDLSVYAVRDALSQKEDLVRCLNKKGWEVRFLSLGAFLSDELVPVLSSGGPLEADCLIAGWKKKGRYAEVLAAWIDRREMQHFRTRTAETVSFGCCELTTSSINQEELSFGEQYAEFTRVVTTEYYLRTSAGRNRVALEFQHAVWEAIGEVTNGLMENQQEGIQKIAKISPIAHLKQWLLERKR